MRLGTIPPTSARADYRVDIRAGVSLRAIRHLLLASCEARGLIDTPVVVTVGSKHPLFFGGVYEPPRSGAADRRPRFRAARGLFAKTGRGPSFANLAHLDLAGHRDSPAALVPLRSRNGCLLVAQQAPIGLRTEMLRRSPSTARSFPPAEACERLERIGDEGMTRAFDAERALGHTNAITHDGRAAVDPGDPLARLE